MSSAPDAETLRHLIADNADGILVIDQDGVVMFANRAAERLLRGGTEPLVGTEFGHPTVVGDMTEIDARATGCVAEMRVSEVQWEGRGALLATLRDVSERRQAERARSHLAAIVESSDDAIAGISAEGLIESWNMGAARLYGYSADEVLGRSIAALFAPEDEAERWRTLARVIEGKRPEQIEARDLHRDGTVIDVSVTDSPVRDSTGRVVGIARVARDITERKRQEHELRFYADHDALTGLLNRRRLGEELSREISYAARYPERAAVLLVCDLDNFKYVNDTLGHQAGDQLIRVMARILGERLRETDIVARLGGDEFAVLLPHTRLEEALTVAESLRLAVHHCETTIRDRKVRTTVSIGAAPLAPDVSAETWLAAGDMAMYEAKHCGRDRVATADPRAQAAPLAAHLGWSERLRDALDHDLFELYRQAIVELASGRTMGQEMLLRMHDRGGGLVLPTRFVHTAERFGLITQIDRWVVREATRLLATDPDRGAVYAVNLSGLSLGDEDLLGWIEQSIGRAGVDPARLIFEYTETAAIRDMDAAQAFTRALEGIGCRSALDDFGSGFGSFSYLKYLPVQFLKIDGEFVRHLPGSDDDRVLVKSIVDVAHGLHKQVVAEHVGSAPAMELLREYGADYAQGFYVGEPRPFDR